MDCLYFICSYQGKSYQHSLVLLLRIISDIFPLSLRILFSVKFCLLLSLPLLLTVSFRLLAQISFVTPSLSHISLVDVKRR